MIFIGTHSFRHVAKYFAKNRAARLITAGLFILVVLALAVGIYEFFLWQFQLVSSDNYFSQTVSLFIW